MQTVSVEDTQLTAWPKLQWVPKAQVMPLKVVEKQHVLILRNFQL
jgi:hypothetical protein